MRQNIQSRFISCLDEHQMVISRLSALDSSVSMAIETILASLNNGGKLMLCGNGGSAADSQHLAAEFVGRFERDRAPLPALALSTDTSAITSIGNDYSFADIFSRQVVGLGRKGDCLLGISTSGNSESVVRAVRSANETGVRTIGLLGKGGGRLASLCDCSIIVPSDVTARIQEAHILIGHAICAAVEDSLGFGSSESNRS